MGRDQKHKYRACSGAFCCGGSRFSVSSSSSDQPERSECESWSRLAHEMVQARLERMINGRRTTAAAGRKLVVLVAREQSSHNPRGDFRESMLEVITSKEMKEPRELRTLLNCYMSLNPREHRQLILEAFHDVCSSLFPVFS